MEFEIEVKKTPVVGNPTDYKPQVEQTKELIETTKKSAEICAKDTFLAHEWIVTKQGDWAKITWKQYCKDIGVDPNTPYRWFKKAGWEYTRTRRLDLLAPASKPKALPLPKETEPELMPDIENIISEVAEKGIAEKDLKKLVDTIADNIEGPTASAVLFHASRQYAKSSRFKIGKLKKVEDSQVVKMVNSFHTFLDRLEAVRGAGTKAMDKYDRETMDQEFKLMVPRALRLFDWMGIELEPILTNYVNRYKEVGHEKGNEKPDVKRLVGD